MRVLLAAAVLFISCLTPLGAQAAVGEQHLLIVLATWGPQPFTQEEVKSAFAEADAFFRSASTSHLPA